VGEEKKEGILQVSTSGRVVCEGVGECHGD